MTINRWIATIHLFNFKLVHVQQIEVKSHPGPQYPSQCLTISCSTFKVRDQTQSIVAHTHGSRYQSLALRCFVQPRGLKFTIQSSFTGTRSKITHSGQADFTVWTDRQKVKNSLRSPIPVRNPSLPQNQCS